jgi:hypothetical protein
VITQPTCSVPTGSVVVSGLPSSGTWTITATPGGSTYTGTGTSYTVSGLAPSTTYSFTVSNSYGCVSLSTSNVVINAIPGAPILGGSTSVCIGSTANVTPSTGGTWTSSNPAIATITNAGLVTGVTAGTVTLTFTQTSTGCSNTMSFTVHALTSCSISGTTGPVCLGSSNNFSAPSGMTTYNWSISGNGTIFGSSSSQNVTVIAGIICNVPFTLILTITNSNGCTSTCQTIVNVNDTTAPTITGTLTATNVEGCGVSAAPAAVTTVAALEALTGNPAISDNCTADGSLVVSSTQSSTGTCPIVITRVYTITDACGNFSTINHTINVDDNTNPTITGTITTTNVEGCGVSAAPAAVTTVAALEALTGNPAISDNCTADASLVVSSTQSSTGTCPIVITRTYTITDACGNFSTINHTINVDDNTNPTITGTITTTNVEGCGVSAAPAAVTTVAALEALTGNPSITDNCTSDGSLVVSSTQTSTGTCPIVITRVYTITDACGNFSTINHTINVDDNTNPTASNPAPIIVDCSADVPTPDVSSVTDEADNCTLIPTVTWLSDVSNGNSNPETITRSFTITDDCGNSVVVQQTITALYDFIPSPTGNENQQVCVGSSLSDLVVYNTIGFTSIYWYDSNDSLNGNLLPNSTILVDGTTYYAFQGNGSCALGLPVQVEVFADIPAPTGDPTQTYCDTEGLTFADAAVFNTTGFDGIYWYADAAQTTPIDPTTVVTTGTYYAFQGVGACADALAVSFTLVADIPAPTGDPTQTYCDTEGLTFADAAVFNTTGFDGIYWYADAAQTTPIDPTTVVTTGTYYAFQGVGACADALAVSFTLVADIPAPTGDPTQTYCDTEGLTFADAAVFNTTGFDGIYWYADAAQTTPIDPTTVVTTGTYYAFQGVGACADALAVSFTLVADIPAPTGDPTQTYCDTEGLTFADAAVFNTTGFRRYLLVCRCSANHSDRSDHCGYHRYVLCVPRSRRLCGCLGGELYFGSGHPGSNGRPHSNLL